MPNLDTHFADNFKYMYNEFKRAITIKVVSYSKDDEGNETQLVDSTTATYGMVRSIDEDLDHSIYGDLQGAASMALLKPTEVINEGDTLVVDSVNYQVTKKIMVDTHGTDTYIEVLLKKSD